LDCRLSLVERNLPKFRCLCIETLIFQAWQNKDDTDAEDKTDPKQLVSNAGEVETRKKHVKIDEHQPEDLHKEWGKVAGRIDLILMAIFLATNIIISALLLAIGNSKLSK
jgi:hypothetical protein